MEGAGGGTGLVGLEGAGGGRFPKGAGLIGGAEEGVRVGLFLWIGGDGRGLVVGLVGGAGVGLTGGVATGLVGVGGLTGGMATGLVGVGGLTGAGLEGLTGSMVVGLARGGGVGLTTGLVGGAGDGLTGMTVGLVGGGRTGLDKGFAGEWALPLSVEKVGGLAVSFAEVGGTGAERFGPADLLPDCTGVLILTGTGSSKESSVNESSS